MAGDRRGAVPVRPAAAAGSRPADRDPCRHPAAHPHGRRGTAGPVRGRPPGGAGRRRAAPCQNDRSAAAVNKRKTAVYGGDGSRAVHGCFCRKGCYKGLSIYYVPGISSPNTRSLSNFCRTIRNLWHSSCCRSGPYRPASSKEPLMIIGR